MSVSEQSKACNMRVYGYVAQHAGWLVTVCEDRGLAAMMAVQGAECIEGKRNGEVRHYWKLTESMFGEMKPHLDALGYIENGRTSKSSGEVSHAGIQPEEASAAYQMPRVAQTAVRTYTVKEIGNLIRGVIRSGFSEDIWVQGELFDASKLSESKWFFGTLVDSTKVGAFGKLDTDNRLKVAIWHEHWVDIREQILAKKLPPLEAGTKIRVRGKLDYSLRYGQPQLNIEEIDPLFTEGEIYKQKRLILEKLRMMGIAEQNKRLAMPMLPLRLAVFSSAEAAGYRDFKNKLMESGFPFRVTFFQVRVQGRELEPMFIEAFSQLEKIGFEAFDLGLILRGGGSMLDLEGFNNLRLGEYVARCPLKFLIAIGHERDKSVLDEIAEFGITPTDAAIMLVKRLQEVETVLQVAASEVTIQSRHRLEQQHHELRLVSSELGRRVIQSQTQAERQLHAEVQKLEKAVTQIRHESLHLLNRFSAELSLYTKSWIQAELEGLKQQAMHMTHRVETMKTRASGMLEQHLSVIRNTVHGHLQAEHQKLDYSGQLICERVRVQKQYAQHELERLFETLKCLDPTDLYRRGFVTLRNAQGKMVKSVSDASVGDQITVRMIDGRLGVTVDGIMPENASDRDEEK